MNHANRHPRRSSRRPTDDATASDFFSNHGRARRDHKTAQLSRQVYWALSLALSDSADDLLRDLTLVAVDPAPDASRLLVRVAPSASATPAGAADILAHLADATGHLRHEVARAITRKRAPELLFVLVAAGEVTE
jgi:ribosome-binding factor A